MPAKIILTGISPALAGLRWESSDQLRLGRHSSMDIVFHDSSICQQHAEIYITFNGWMIRRLDGKALVNGVPIGEAAHRLQAEDVLQLGNLTVRVSDLDEVKRAAAPARQQSADIKTTGPLLRVQASSRKSWEQGLKELDRNDGGLSHGKQFLTLLRGGYLFSRVDNLQELLGAFLAEALSVFNAQRGAILLLDKHGDLTLSASASAAGSAAAKCFSSTLAQRCFAKGESLLCADAALESLADTSVKSGKQSSMASIICAFLRSPRRRLGVLHLDRGPLDELFTQEHLTLADSVAASIAIPIEAALDVETQLGAVADDAFRLAEFVLHLQPCSICTRPKEETRDHCRRTATLATRLGEIRGLPKKELHEVRVAALLHEVDEESVRRLPAIAATIRHINERWDGTGLPDHFDGERIPLLSRIIAIAHAIDELMHRQQSPLPWTEAIACIQRLAGKAFDPQLAATLARLTENTGATA